MKLLAVCSSPCIQLSLNLGNDIIHAVCLQLSDKLVDQFINIRVLTKLQGAMVLRIHIGYSRNLVLNRLRIEYKASIGRSNSGLIQFLHLLHLFLRNGSKYITYLLAFAAGAMLYVVVEELIPEMSEGEHSNIGTIFFALGFTLMMMLDVALG